MEDQRVIGTNFTKEVSDSRSSENKRVKLNGNGNGNGNSSSSSKFKGVVLQQNGHWGAQIYANHQRIWLGTFRSEIEAATAYDSAAIKLRSRDSPSHRNFPWTKANIEEPKFQSQFNTETVLSMIKDGTYALKFVEYLREAESKAREDSVAAIPKHETFFCNKLFQKELTPSDVGKLNRLVIPKKFAVMYFPHISECVENNGDETELVFFDRELKSWKFRYCYWKSSQSFVFTRGWNRFVKDKGLRAKDMIIFSFCECKDGSNEMQSFLIDVEYYEDFHGGGVVQNTSVEDKDTQGMESNGSTKHEFRLFGVQII